jgi:hypothetical protein
MSFAGSNPKSVTYTFTPQSADPSNPAEGDVYFSDGTPRDVGLWVYASGAWSQVSTGATLSVLDTLTLTPQSADPAIPAEGMIFMSDGTVRTEGLWLYVNGDWTQITGAKYQEFRIREYFDVRAASTANIILASQLENGDSFGGVTLATGNFALVKNQTDPTENGVYVVQLSGPPVRHTDYDTASELTRAAIYVTAGTNAGTKWYQNNTLSTLADPQSWANTPAAFSFTVPNDVTKLRLLGCGGGGGGGGGYNAVAVTAAGGGGGGAGCISDLLLNCTPGEILTINLGRGGVGGTLSGNGSNGTSTTIVGSIGLAATMYYGGGGGGGGLNGNDSPLADGGVTGNRGGGGGSSSGVGGIGSHIPDTNAEVGKNGGGGGGGNGFSTRQAAGGVSLYYGTGGPVSAGVAGGGGGGSAFAIGGTGANSTTKPTRASNNGGGGGGGYGVGTGANRGDGGDGGDGILRIYW